MRQVKFNPLMKGYIGAIGDEIVFKQLRGKIIITRKPKMRPSNSPAQQAQINLYKEASKYAKTQTSTPEGKAEYATRINGRKHCAYLVALADYLNKPKIHKIEVSEYRGNIGNKIFIDATDDFKIVRVTVTIITADNVELEQGDAKEHDVTLDWVYTAIKINACVAGTVVRVKVWDKPGNEVMMDVHMT